MALGKTAKLEAVNTMLGFIGEAPLGSLEETTGVGDAPMAEKVLDEISREVQSQGWHFNTEYDVELVPDASKYLVFSDSIIRVDIDRGRYPNNDVTLRGQKLYDKTNKTYEFDEELKGETVTLFDWDDLPEPARRYITLRAARVLQDRAVGSTELTQIGIREEMGALASLREYDSSTEDASVFDSYLPAATISDYRRN